MHIQACIRSIRHVPTGTLIPKGPLPHEIIYDGQGRLEDILVNGNYFFIESNTWTHVAFMFDPVNGPAMYANGVLKSQKPWKGGVIDYSMPNSFRVGAYKDDEMGLRAFRGGVDEVRLWQGRVSQAQIMARMATRLTGLEVSPFLWV